MIKPEEIPSLYQKLKSHIARDFRPTVTTIVSGGGGATSFSGLTGTIANAQAPQFLLRDGSRSLTGNLLVDAGVTIDGVDLSSHALDPDAHHARQHSITGTDHSITGAALSLVGATATNTLGLITPSASPGAAEAVLKSSSAGNLTLPTFTASTKLTAPLIDTASGDLTISPAGGDIFVNGNIAAQRGGALTTISAYSAGTGGSHYPRSILYQARGALGSETATQSSDILGAVSFRGHDGSAYMTFGAAEIRGVASENFSSTAEGTSLRFLTTASGSSTLAERMRIHDSGNVSIRNTVDSGSALDVTGSGRFSSSVSVGDGSTTTPGLNFGADTNTGIYRSGTDAFGLVAGGASIINVGVTGVGVNTTFDSTAALKVQSVANDDITLFLKQKSGQTARMWRVEDSAGQELIVLDSQGNLQSGNPGFVSGLTGWQIQPTGTAEFNNVWIRGELHASIFVMDEFHASGGTLVVAPAGKLENDATVYTTTGVEQVLDLRTTSVSGSGLQLDIRTTSGSGSGTQLTVRWVQNYFDITDPPSGHAMVFSFGDTLRCKSLGNPGVGVNLYDIWGTVTLVEDMTDYYRYYYQRQSGGSNGIVIPAGTAIISYGAPGDGRILLTADQNYAPYIDIFTVGAQPWNGDITPHTRLGRLDGVGLPGVSGIEQYGMVTGRDLSDATAPYIVNSNLQMFSYNVDSEWNNGNPTARITSGGVFKLGTDIDNASTTGLDFNPVTGALTIGSAAYPGTVTVYGSITVTGGSGIGNFTDANLDNIANTASFAKTTPNQVTGAGRAFTALSSGNNLVTSVIPATAIGNPGTAGLYLGSDYMGYHTGNGLSTGWKTYMDSSGNMRLQGNSTTNYLQWSASSNRLQGVGGGTEQWYADATDGRLKFGGGNGYLDVDGLTLLGDSTATHSSQSSTRAVQFERSNGTLIGRLTSYYLSGGDDYGLDIYARSPNTEDTYATFGAEQAGTAYGGGAAGAPRLVAYSSAGGSDYLRLYANTEIALYRSGSASPDVTLNSAGVTVNTDLDMNGYNIIDANNIISIRTTAP